MKPSFSISMAALTLAGASLAAAADLPARKSPPPYAPPPPQQLIWTGFYVGLNAGGFFDPGVSTVTYPGIDNTFTNPPVLAPVSAALATGRVGSDPSGFLGGGQVGYNFQIQPNWVLGLEADIEGVAGSSGTGTRYTAAPLATGTPGDFLYSVLRSSKSIDYLGTVRGRVGFLVTPSLLLYGSGGLAYGGVNASTSIFQWGLFSVDGPATTTGIGGGAASSFSDTRIGWTAGGGGEWMFSPRWSAKVEYLYYDLGNVSFALPPLVLADVTGFVRSTAFPISSARFNGHIVRAGINYHFN